MKHFAVALLTLMLAACAARSDISGANLHEAARINAQLGIDYFRKGELNLAIEKLQRAIDQNPNLVLAHSSLALVYSRRGDTKLAEKEYRIAAALEPNNADVQNNFGVFLCAQERIVEAERYFISAAQTPQYKTPQAAWTNAGVCLRKTQPERAESYFRKALELAPDFADALSNMAWLTFQKQDYWRTRAFLQRYELNSQATAETLWVGALTERKLGDAAAATRYERRLRSEFPASEEAANLPKQ